MKVSVALLAAALFMTAGLAGCSSKKGDAAADAATSASSAPGLYLNVTIGNQTFRFANVLKDTVKHPEVSGGNHSASSSGSASGNATHSHSGSSSSGNATGHGNATMAKGNSTGNLSKPMGTAPLNVSATLGASGIPVGKAIAWTFDFGDRAATAAGNATKAGNATHSSSSSSSAAGNHTSSSGTHTAPASAAAGLSGTKVPAKVDHTFTTPGLYNLTFSLRVANGTATVLKASVDVLNGTGNLTGAVKPGTVLGSVPLDFTGTFTAGVGVGAPTPVNCGSGVGASKSVDWIFPATDNATGAPAAVSHVTITSDGSNDNMDADLYFVGPDGTVIASATSGSPDETIDQDGPFAPGTYQVQFKACAAVNDAYTVHGDATLVAA